MNDKIINLQTLSKDYDAFLIDAWGVLHGGGAVFPKALECLISLKNQSKQVVIISNAARRTDKFNQELLLSGIDKRFYDFSLSSGELVWQNLRQKALNSVYQISGNRCFYLGPSRSAGLLNDLELDVVSNIEKADFILNTGVEGNLPHAHSFNEVLRIATEKQLPMICANPDLVAIRKGVRGISAGAIAKLYKELGGVVEYTGKPYSQIFDVCYKKLGNVPKDRILMIGDGLQTDIRGAKNFGIDSLFIADGIYQQRIDELQQYSSDEETSLKALFVEENVEPTFFTDSLCY